MLTKEKETIILVVEKLFLGNLEAAKNTELLKSFGVTHILCVGKELEPNQVSLIFNNHKNFVTLKINVLDDCSENILIGFEKIYEFIEDGMREGNVFIHCRGGHSRSPSITIAFLMKKYSWKFLKAYQYLKEKKKDITPNSGFIEFLKSSDVIIEEKIKQTKITEYYKFNN